ncbi:ABC transporter permease [Bifidobacterium bombi]|uniref:Peptide ABC transporter, permease protein n=1 Tax=Bifidobacterium bombi DSM 19703 TaxID=1341695 RepID=A0A080N2K8_9BIFI|nr:ABC transporter permease [Bifidobacterium bombi]KFF31081.1 peptide ABC transporter, permease protein [Bifidobacterium bombi DSM 19703]
MRFVLQRLALFVVTLLGVSVLVFAALRVLPGDMAQLMAGMNSTPGRVASIRKSMGLDRPVFEQYTGWLWGLMHGDFGMSMLTGRAIAATVKTRASVTFPLIALGLLAAMVIGLVFGYEATMSHRPAVRVMFHLLALVGGAIPALWGGLLLILLFSKGMGIIGLFPSQGFPASGWRQPVQALSSLALPALTVGIIDGATLMRYTRSALTELLSSDVIAMTMASGYTRRQAMVRVGFRLALPQLVSVTGLLFASMVTGVMVIENLFALPGIGYGLVTDLGNRDLIAVQSELFMLAAFFLFVGFIVDVIHRLLDPRMRHPEQEG